jgi:hypothetical protein
LTHIDPDIGISRTAAVDAPSPRVHQVVLLAGFVLTFVGFFPGLMSPDSVVQFGQAQRFAFSDHHPVVMALIWAGTNAVFPGPQGFFLLLLLMYWGGFSLICRYFAQRARPAFWVALVVPFLPFVINFSGTLWKDVLVFDCFLLSIGVILSHVNRGARVPALSSALLLLLLTIGALARHNSILAAIPLAALLLWPHAPEERPRVAVAGRLAAAAVVLVLLYSASNAVLSRVLRPERTYPMAQLFLFDIAGISNRTGTLLLPGSWTDAESQSIRECYRPRSWDFLWLNCDFAIARLHDEGRWSRLFRPWLRTVRAHPLLYVEHRSAYVWEFFQPSHLIFNFPVERASIEHGFSQNVVLTTVKWFVLKSASTFPFSLFFTNAFWFGAAPALLFVHLWLFGRDRLATYPGLLVSASGAFYTAPLAVVGIAHDFRYLYWGIGASCVALAFLADTWSSTRSGKKSGNALGPAERRLHEQP